MLSGGRLAYFGERPQPSPRYGHGAPPHDLLTKLFRERDDQYASILRGLRDFQAYFRRIPHTQIDATTPFWLNGWLPPLDAAALYAFLARSNPRLYIEVGSGNSTKFARRAILDHRLRTTLISIDPRPRAPVDDLCDVVFRVRFEDLGPAWLPDLGAGDIIFVDGSHRMLMNSDVTAIFLELLPRLPPAVLVHFHDIWLPYDYPKRWQYWYFSEQYALAAALLLAPDRFTVLLPCMYVAVRPRLSETVAQFLGSLGLQGIKHGGSFWLEIARTQKRQCQPCY